MLNDKKKVNKVLNIERYKEELKKCKRVRLDCQICKMREERKEVESGFCFSNPCSACREDNIEWLLSEAQILDDAEKRYLRGVIRPFRDKVKCILKCSNSREWIEIRIINNAKINFPYFEKCSMYKGMELDREYTLEELEL